MSRAEWAGKLAVLVAPDRVDEATATLSQIVTMLDDLPDRCFTSRSALTAVAQWKKRTIIPTLTDIRAALRDWMRDHIEPSDGPASWKPEETAWHDYWLRRQATGFHPPLSPHSDHRANLLDLIKCQCPKVWRHIMGPDYREPELEMVRPEDVDAIMERYRRRAR